MNLIDELVSAYLFNSMEIFHYLDLETGLVVLDFAKGYSNEPGIDWEDEASEDRYIGIPQVDSNEGFYLMTKFAQRTTSDPEDKLFDALDRPKPFRRFRDTLDELDLWDEWNKFEHDYAEQEIREWLERSELDYVLLNEKFIKNN